MAHGAPIDTNACGQTAPFFLDAGISSTERIAEFWDLTAAQPERGAREANGHRQPHAQGRPAAGIVIDQHGNILADAPGRTEASEAGGKGSGAEHRTWRQQLDPGSTITKALRAAGLMK
jgi:hypothetical protein